MKVFQVIFASCGVIKVGAAQSEGWVDARKPNRVSQLSMVAAA